MKVLIRWAALLPALLTAGAALAQAPTKMTIATGVDPSFSQFYVAKEAGIFARNGLDVQVNTGPSGSAMVALLIGNQINAAFGAEQAGVTAHAVDPNVVMVADGVELQRWMAVVGSPAVPDLAALKGKKVGVARGTGSETFWLAVLKAKGLNATDYKVVNVEAPEMVAAMERGDVDSFAIWEPWVSRGQAAVKGSRSLVTNEGVINIRTFVYMNRDWVSKNTDASRRFVKSIAEAADFINSNRPEAAAMVARFLKQPPDFIADLMSKLEFHATIGDQTLSNFEVAIGQLKAANKLSKPVTPRELVMTDLLAAVRPEAVTIKD